METVETSPKSESATDTEKSNAIEAMSERKFRIPGDVVNKATAALPEEQRSAIRWLHAHAADKNLSLKELGGRIRYEDSVLSRLFRGAYTGSLDNVCKAIVSYKDLEEKRATVRRAPFVTTTLVRKTWRIFDAALTYQKVSFIYAESHAGKTTSAMEYQRTHNHGQTIYVRMPAGGAMVNFLVELAIALRINPQQKEKELRRRVIEAIDDRMLLIIDQAHECFRSQYSNRSTMSLLFAMEIHDRRGCGLVIIGTNVLREEVETGKMKGVLRQLGMRSLASLQLKDKPSVADLNKFAEAYELPPATDEALKVQTEVVQEASLGKWCTVLQAASRLATKQNKKLAWSHVIAADAGIKSLEKLQEAQ